MLKQIDIESDTASLTSQTYQRLHSMILQGELEPGLKLKIDGLCKTLGTGASPIREALSLLTSDQLVERIDQRGFRVAYISSDGFKDLLKTRCWLEELALRESIAAGDDAWEEQIVLLHHRLVRAPRSIEDKNFVSNVDWETHHKKFHIALISACGSSILLKICNQLYDQNIRYRNIAGQMAYQKRYVNNEHDAILKYALDRDADKAVLELTNHYKKTGEFLAKQLK